MRPWRSPLALVHPAAPPKRPEFLSVAEPQPEDYEWRQDATVKALMAALGVEDVPGETAA